MKHIVKKYRKVLGITLFAILFSVFVSLLILPADFFDNGQSVCLSVVFFDTECFGCGMTRAIQHLIHLDFKEAYQFNKLSFIVFPLMIFMILFELRKMIFDK